MQEKLERMMGARSVKSFEHKLQKKREEFVSHNDSESKNDNTDSGKDHKGRYNQFREEFEDIFEKMLDDKKNNNLKQNQP